MTRATIAFRARIHAFLKRSGMTATAFGKKAVGDPNFVHDLRRGRSPSLDMCARVTRFMLIKGKAL